MRMYAVFLTSVAFVIAGCTRNEELASNDVVAEAPETASVETVSQIYTIDDYDPGRNVNADLLDTIEQAKNCNKRIILEIGGRW